MQTRAQVAAVVGGAVLAYLIVQQVVFTVGYVTGLPFDQVLKMLSSTGGLMFSQYLPFSVGVFVSLWLIAPIAPIAAEASLAKTLKRSVLAAGIGAAVVVIVRTVIGSAGAFSGVGSFFANSFPTLPIDSIAWAFGHGIQAGLASFVQVLPLVILVGVLAWMWLAKHPSRHEVSIDSTEV